MRYFGITDLALASFFLAILECGIQTYSAILTMACKSLSKLMQLQANKPRSATQNAICGERNGQTPKRSTQFFIERAWNREKRRFKKKRSRRSLSRREVDFLVWRLSDRISGLSGKISSQRPPGSPWKKAISPQLLQWSVLTVSGRKPWMHWEALRCEWL